ncbi:MAG: OST-HTH/LOTUS domain-containing protein, partial [candidate division NC10 bacterium]
GFLVRGIKKPRMESLPPKKAGAFELLIDSILALSRENKDILWASMVKQTMMRKRPDFNESYYGYSTFSKLLEDASKHHIVELKRDDRSRTYIIVGLGEGH